MENYIKNFYIILILFFSFTIYSCAKKSDSSSSSSTTELEGTWQTPCHLPEGSSYYRIKKLTVSGTNWTDTAEYHSDSSCATDYDLWLATWGSLSIGDAIEVSGVSGHKFTMTVIDKTFTPQSSDNVSGCNTNSCWGLTGWELNTPQSVNWWSKGTSAYGKYTLDGSEIFQCVSMVDYPSSSCLPTTGWFKQ